MPSEALRSDAIRDGFVDVPPGVATPLSAKPQQIVSLVVWNRTGVDLGVGGATLETDEHLFPGESYSSRVRDLSQVFVFHRASGPRRVRFTYEV